MNANRHQVSFGDHRKVLLVGPGFLLGVRGGGGLWPGDSGAPLSEPHPLPAGPPWALCAGSALALQKLQPGRMGAFLVCHSDSAPDGQKNPWSQT